MQTTADVHVHVEDPPLKIGKSTITTSIDSVPSFSGRTKNISEIVHIVRDNKPPQNNTKDTLVCLKFGSAEDASLKQTFDNVPRARSELELPEGSSPKKTADGVPEGSGHEFSFIKGSPLKKTANEVPDEESKTELSHPQGDSKKDTSDEVSRSRGSESEMSSPEDSSLNKTPDEVPAAESKSELSHPQDASIKETSYESGKPGSELGPSLKSEFSLSEEPLLKETSDEASEGSRSELRLPENAKVKDTSIEICEESSLPEEVSLIENLNAGPEKFAGKGFRSEDHGDLLTRIWKTITTNSSMTTACNSPICRYIIIALLIIGVVCTCIFVPIYVHEVGNKENSSDLSGNEDTLISGSPPSNGTIAPPTSYYEPTVFINGTALKLVAKSCGGTGNNFWAKNGKDIVADIMCKVSKDRYELLPTAEGYCILQIKNFSNMDVGRYSYRHGFCQEVVIDTTEEPIIGTVKWSCPQLLPSFEMTVLHFPTNVSFQAFLDGQPINVTDVGVTKIVGKNLHQSTITVDLNNINSSLEIYFWNQYGQVWKIHKGEVKLCPRKNGSETKDSSDVNWYVVVFPAAVIVMVAVFLVALYKNKKWRSACLGRQGDGSAQGNNPPEVDTLGMDNFSTKEGHDASAADGGSDVMYT